MKVNDHRKKSFRRILCFKTKADQMGLNGKRKSLKVFGKFE